MQAMKATVFGKVQGVWFRDSTCTEAQNLNIFGWVKNMPDGTVMLEAEGEESDLKQLEAWLHVGSPRSTVERVDVEWQKAHGNFLTFEINF